MLNEYSYCPRLAYLEWVQADFADSADTVDGRRVHRRVDRPSGAIKEPSEPPAKLHARSVELAAPRFGMVAKMDLLEVDGLDVTPVDYKRGSPPDVPERAWEPERVQLCAQALILEEHGYRCASGVLYFAEAKQRVEVPFDAELRARTRALLDGLRAAVIAEAAPPPLDDSPKCPRCSLVGICLPDEVNLLRGGCTEPRKLVPARDDALPLYVRTAGSRVGKRGDELVIEDREGGKQYVPLMRTSQVVLMGGVQVSTQALHELCERGTPVVYLSAGARFFGLATGMPHKNVELRLAQFRAATSETRALGLARRLVATKIRNQRTLLRRNGDGVPDGVLDRLRELAVAAEEVGAAESLLGLEGTAARLYFEQFERMLRAPGLGFDFEGRNRRPPKDPVNALLSLAYALLTKELTVVLLSVGFDPYLGFFHQPRHGRPALALDLMEEFRPLIADSVTLTAINTGVVKEGDFVRRGMGCAMTDAGRGRFIEAFERRMDELITHPTFGYRVSYRRILEVQARLLGRHLMGEVPDPPSFLTR